MKDLMSHLSAYMQEARITGAMGALTLRFQTCPPGLDHHGDPLRQILSLSPFTKEKTKAQSSYVAPSHQLGHGGTRIQTQLSWLQICALHHWVKLVIHKRQVGNTPECLCPFPPPTSWEKINLF